MHLHKNKLPENLFLHNSSLHSTCPLSAPHLLTRQSMAPQYFTIFQCLQILESWKYNPWSPPKSGNVWYFQYTEYCDRMGAETWQWMFFCPQKFCSSYFSLRMLRAFSGGISVLNLKFRTQSRNEQAHSPWIFDLRHRFGCGFS